MPELAETLNTPESATSADSTDVAAGSSAPDTGVKKPDSTPESLASHLDAVELEEPADAGDITQAGGAESKAADAPPHAEAEDGEAEADGAGGNQDERPPAEANADGSLNVPFAKRPEWMGLMATVPKEIHGEVIKHIRPVFEQAQRLEVAVRDLKPKAKVLEEFQHYAGDEKGFETMRQIIRSYANDPAASVPVLENMLADARQRGGLVITSPDLTARLAELDQQVAEGLLDEQAAARWKADLTAVEKSRVTDKAAQTRLQQADQQRQQAQAQAAQKQTSDQLNAWEENIRGRDPSFGDVTEDNDPLHGTSVADQVLDALRLKQATQPQATTAELIAEANRVHKLAKSRLAGPAKLQRVVTSAGSSVTANRKPASLMDAMNAVKLE